MAGIVVAFSLVFFGDAKLSLTGGLDDALEGLRHLLVSVHIGGGRPIGRST